MVDVPEYQLNDPFTLPEGQREQLMTEKEKQEALNKMWRNAVFQCGCRRNDLKGRSRLVGIVDAVLSDHADPACSDGQLPH